jgi:hypothetical protein
MIDDDPNYVNLETLGEGMAVERFNDAWQQVLENIKDPNTKATTIREVTLKVKIKPSEDRDRALVTLEAIPKLAPAKVIDTLVYLSKLRDEGVLKTVASEHIPKQPRIFADEEMRGGVS